MKVELFFPEALDERMKASFDGEGKIEVQMANLILTAVGNKIITEKKAEIEKASKEANETELNEVAVAVSKELGWT